MPTKEEAVNNIQKAKEFGVPPDAYPELKDDLNEGIASAPEPVDPVRRAMASSEQEATVIKPDISTFNSLQKQIEFGKLTLEGKEMSNELFDIQSRAAFGDQINEEEAFKVRNLNREFRRLNDGKLEYDYNFAQSLPSEVLAGGYDILDTIGESHDLVLFGAGAGGVAGFGLGLTTMNPIGMLAGTIYGAQVGASASLTLGFFRRSMRQTTGQIYNDLTRVLPEVEKDQINRREIMLQRVKDGTAAPSDVPPMPETNIRDLPEEEIRAISRGAGIISGSIGLLPGKAISKGISKVTGNLGTKAMQKMAKQFPFLAKISTPRAVAKYVTSNQGGKLRRVITMIGNSPAISEALEEATQEVVQAIGVEMAKTWDGTETSFVDGLTNALSKFETYEAAGKAGVVGGIVGKVADVGLKTAAKVTEPTVTPPPSPPQVEGSVDPDAVDPDTAPDAKDVNQEPESPTRVKGIKALILYNLLERDRVMVAQTETKEGVPDKVDEIRKRMYEDAGMSDVFVDKDELNAWADSEEKAAKARSLFGPKEYIASENNAPIRLELYKFMKIADDHPEILKLIKAEADGPSYMNFSMQIEEADTKRQELLAEIATIDEKTLNEETKLPAESVSGATLKSNLLDEGKKGTSIERPIRGLKTTNAFSSLPDSEKVLSPDETSRRYVVERNESGKPIGVLAFDVNQSNTSHIETRKDYTDGLVVWVDENHRGKGLASKLYNFAKSKGYNTDLISGKFGVTELGAEFVKKRINKDIEQPIRLRDEDIQGESDYLNQDTFTPEMTDVLPAKEIEKLNLTERKVRDEIKEEIRKLQIRDNTRILKLQERIDNILNEESARDEATRPEKVQVVDDFLDNSRVIGDLTPNQKKRQSKGMPVHAINPESLSDAQRTKYLKDPVLRARKVFSKDGYDIGDVIIHYGVDSGDTFLDTMANSPTSEQLAVNTGEMDITDVEGFEDIDTSDFAKKYDKMVLIRLKHAKILRDKYWPVYRKGIKRIALDIRQLRSRLDTRARDVIGDSKVREINARPWEVGSARSQRKAVDAILSGKIEEAMREKQNSVFNDMLAKHSHIAAKKVDKALNFIASLASPRNQRMLRDAGKSYVDAVKFYTDLYTINERGIEDKTAKDYKTHIDKMIELGNGDQRVTAEEMEWLSTAESSNELTVDQLLFIEGKLREVMHDAKQENSLIRQEENQTLELIEQELHEQALTNVDYDESRNDEIVTRPSLGERMGQLSDTAETLINNNQFMTQELDQNQLNGKYYLALQAPIQGVGTYEGPKGFIALSNLRGQYGKLFNKAVKKSYKGWMEFKNFAVVTVDVPEFAGKPGFNKEGRVSKENLLMLLLNTGNPSNAEYISNHGLTVETVRTVAKRELGKQAFDFSQSVWDLFKTMAPRIDATTKALKGRVTEFVQPQAFEEFDTQYSGGYFPVTLRTADKDIADVASQTISDITSFDALDLNSDRPMTPRPDYEGFVRNPHTRQRKGSNLLLDLSMERMSRALDDMIYDVTMSEPIRDVMVLLKRKQIKRDIIAQVGKVKYRAMVNNVAGLTKYASNYTDGLYTDTDNFLRGIYSSVEGAFAVNYIAFRLTSAGMSTLAIPQIISKMGPKAAARHLIPTATKLGASLVRPGGGIKAWKAAYDLATEIDPALTLTKYGLEDYDMSAIKNYVPKDRLFKSKGYNALKNVQEAAIRMAFSGILGGIDTIIKTFSTVAIYNMYVNGDAPDFDYNRVHQGKTPEQVHRDAKAYVSQFLENTTMRAGVFDKAAIQKTPVGRMFTLFWNEQRGALNLANNGLKRTRRDMVQMVQSAQSGDYEKAKSHFEGAGGRAAWGLTIAMISGWMFNFVKFGAPFIDEEEDDKWDMEDSMEDQLAKMPRFLFEGYANPLKTYKDHVSSLIPLQRQMIFGVDRLDRDGLPKQGVSVPRFKAFTDIRDAGIASKQFVNQAVDEMSLVYAWEDLTPQQFTAMTNSVGYFVGGIPALNQVRQTMRWMDDEGIEMSGSLINADFVKLIDGFLEDQGYDDPEEIAFRARQAARTGEISYKDAFAKEMKDVRDKLSPQIQGDLMPQIAYDIIAQAESGGRWYAKNPHSSAFGKYQFTRGTWSELVNSPEGRKAGLYEEGRLQRTTGQQEIGMKLLTKQNAIVLRKKGVPVTLESIYFAHHFGPSHADIVYNKPDDYKLPKSLLTPLVLEQNPNLVKLNVKTAGDMKKYIRDILKRAEKDLD